MNAVGTKPCEWRRRVMVDPGLRNCHIVVAAPGGSAAEAELLLPPGTTHLLEHLLYRQNGLRGSRLDHLGGKYGLQTGRETMIAYLAFPPRAALEVIASIVGWWDSPVFDRAVFDQERDVIADEVSGAKNNADRDLRMRVLRKLFAASAIARDFVGAENQFMEVAYDMVASVHARVRSLGAALAVLTPESVPLPATVSFQSAAWVPEAPARTELRSAIESTVTPARALVLGALALPGMRSPSFTSSLALYAALEYGRAHPAQREFHEAMRLRFLSTQLQVFADTSLLLVKATCPPKAVRRTERIVAEILADPLAGTDSERLRNVTSYHIGALLDNPQRHVIEEAQRLLVGAPSLESLAALAREIDLETAARLLNRAEAAGGPAARAKSPVHRTNREDHSLEPT